MFKNYAYDGTLKDKKAPRIDSTNRTGAGYDEFENVLQQQKHVLKDDPNARYNAGIALGDPESADIRIVSLGYAQSGNSSLMLRLMYDEYDDEPMDNDLLQWEQHQMNYHFLDDHGEDETLRISYFDLKGFDDCLSKSEMSERIGEVINHSFNVILLYYAIDNDTSFEDSNGYSVQDIKRIVDQYLQLIDSSKFMLLLVGLKLDTENEDYREVSTTQGVTVAEKWNVPFIEVSAQTGENIKDLLDIICTIYTRAFHVIDGDLIEAAAFDEDEVTQKTIIQEDEEYEEYKEPQREVMNRKYSDVIAGEIKAVRLGVEDDDILQEGDEDSDDESVESEKEDVPKKKTSILDKFGHLDIDPTKLKVGAVHPTQSKPKPKGKDRELDHSSLLNKATQVKKQRRKRTRKRVELDDDCTDDETEDKQSESHDVHKDEKEAPTQEETVSPSEDDKKESIQRTDKKEMEPEPEPEPQPKAKKRDKTKQSVPQKEATQVKEDKKEKTPLKDKKIEAVKDKPVKKVADTKKKKGKKEPHVDKKKKADTKKEALKQIEVAVKPKHTTTDPKSPSKKKKKGKKEVAKAPKTPTKKQKSKKEDKPKKEAKGPKVQKTPKKEHKQKAKKPKARSKSPKKVKAEKVDTASKKAKKPKKEKKHKTKKEDKEKKKRTPIQWDDEVTQQPQPEKKSIKKKKKGKSKKKPLDTKVNIIPDTAPSEEAMAKKAYVITPMVKDEDAATTPDIEPTQAKAQEAVKEDDTIESDTKDETEPEPSKKDAKSDEKTEWKPQKEPLQDKEIETKQEAPTDEVDEVDGGIEIESKEEEQDKEVSEPQPQLKAKKPTHKQVASNAEHQKFDVDIDVIEDDKPLLPSSVPEEEKEKVKRKRKKKKKRFRKKTIVIPAAFQQLSDTPKRRRPRNAGFSKKTMSVNEFRAVPLNILFENDELLKDNYDIAKKIGKFYDGQFGDKDTVCMVAEAGKQPAISYWVKGNYVRKEKNCNGKHILVYRACKHRECKAPKVARSEFEKFVKRISIDYEDFSVNKICDMMDEKFGDGCHYARSTTKRAQYDIYSRFSDKYDAGFKLPSGAYIIAWRR